MVCLYERETIINEGWVLYSSVSYDGNSVLWEVVVDRVLDNQKYNDEIGIQGFSFNFFGEERGGGGKREFLIWCTYLLMLMNI